MLKLNSVLSLLLILPIMFVSIIQYPYYLFERYDHSITIYQFDYYGQLIPLYNFPNLATMVCQLGGYSCIW